MSPRVKKILWGLLALVIVLLIVWIIGVQAGSGPEGKVTSRTTIGGPPPQV